ncbi:DUF2726 domain-containing protein [Vibrio alginolyticus]|nr:DUF2726 domain-containing protein [Vibrio alginolyticus]
MPSIDNLLFPLILVAVYYVFVHKPSYQKKKGKIAGQFRPCETLNTKAEQVFKHVLKSRLPDNLELHCKVRLADLVLPSDPKNFVSLNKVTSKHVDFVVVDSQSAQIIFAVELDDKSHNSKKSKIQDSEKDYALDSAGVPLYRVKTGSDYHDATTQILAKHL